MTKSGGKSMRKLLGSSPNPKLHVDASSLNGVRLKFAEGDHLSRVTKEMIADRNYLTIGSEDADATSSNDDKLKQEIRIRVARLEAQSKARIRGSYRVAATLSSRSTKKHRTTSSKSNG